MNQNMGRLIRYVLIIQKLSGKKKFIPAKELISSLNLQMELRGYDVGLILRTLQRDIEEIKGMFEIEIKNRRGAGYFIADRVENADIRYEELLLNLVDNDEEFRIRLRLWITNDFVMALLARSNSLTVISPKSLRERIIKIYQQALKRNQI